MKRMRVRAVQIPVLGLLRREEPGSFVALASSEGTSSAIVLIALKKKTAPLGPHVAKKRATSSPTPS